MSWGLGRQGGLWNQTGSEEGQVGDCWGRVTAGRECQASPQQAMSPK